MHLTRVANLILCLLGLNNIATRACCNEREVARSTAAYARRIRAAAIMQLRANQDQGRRRDLG